MLEDTRSVSNAIGAAATRHVQAHFIAAGSEEVRWVVEGATITSSMNQPYLIDIDLQTDRTDSDPMALFGVAAELRVMRVAHQNTYGGIVSSVRPRGRGDFGVRVRVTVEPALSALRHGRDTRIFQDMTVPEVIESVLGEELQPYGRTLRLELRRNYPKREYTVQYQESDFDFCQRLMEEEGIFYYFVQNEAIETLVLIDGAAQYPRAAEPLVRYTTVDGDFSALEEEYVREFEPVARIGATTVATRHFDWTHPSALIEGSAEGTGPGPVRESYEHDEPFTLHGFSNAYSASDVADQNRVRREAGRRPQQLFHGRGTVVELRAGERFDLTGHPHGLDGAYVVVQDRHYVLGHVGRASLAGGERQARYMNVFTCATADTPWRPQRVHPRPRIRGIQTAIVTGPPGEEIHCDEHGRIKVQFHWDREGQLNERTSCWIRVMQTSAGSGFGAWVLPRVGWEVVVSFIDGDPDRPLVTGCVYNGDQPLPYPLPEKKALTLFKSNSYPGGGGSNELRMDDTKHGEEIYLHGEKDWNTVINHDHTRTVGHDETQSVGHDRTRSVGNNETISVGVNRTRSVGADEMLSVGANRTRMVGANESVAVGANQSVTVASNQSTAIGANADLQVAGDRSVSVAGSQTVSVGVSENYKIGSSSNLKVGKMRKRKVGLMEMVNVGLVQMVNAGIVRMVSAGLVHMINAGMLMKLKAGAKLELGVGPSKVVLTKSGVLIEGKLITLSGKTEVKQKAPKIHLNP